jgi:hypothetical protein
MTAKPKCEKIAVTTTIFGNEDQGGMMSAAPNRTKHAASLLTAALVVTLTACDRENRHFPHVDVIGPTPSLTAVIVPGVLTLNAIAGRRCPFTTAFDLVIDHQSGNDLFMEQVTIRLLDGSNVGGSPVLMSSVDLAARLGSTRVRSGTTSRFGFAPRFGCETFRPHSVRTDLLLRDASGVQQTMRLIVPIG